MKAAPSEGESILVDGHVHFYDRFPLRRFLDGAATNFQSGARQAAAHGSSGVHHPVMILLDGRDGCPFTRLRSEVEGEMADDGLAYRFRWDPPPGPATMGDPPPFLAVAGRQIGTAERLEVLAIPSLDRFPHGRTLTDTVRSVRAAGALPVLAWGLGKWWFGRGRQVLEFLDSPLGPPILLGDNGNRPRWLPGSRILRAGAARGLPVLPGSDPLPLEEHATRAGSFGFILEGRLDRSRPAEDLATRLSELSTSPPTFGRRTGPAATLMANLKLRAAR